MPSDCGQRSRNSQRVHRKRFGEDVLCHHINGVAAGDCVVYGVLQLRMECVEPFAECLVLGFSNRFSMRPTSLPKISATSFASFPSISCRRISRRFWGVSLGWNINRQKHLLTGGCFFTVPFTTAEDNPIGERFIEVDSVDFSVKSVVRGSGVRGGHPIRLRTVRYHPKH